VILVLIVLVVMLFGNVPIGLTICFSTCSTDFRSALVCVLVRVRSLVLQDLDQLVEAGRDD